MISWLAPSLAITADAIVPASHAITIRRVRFNQPVADIELRVGAKTEQLALGRVRPPVVAVRLKRSERLGVRDVAQAAAALFALVVFKI